MKKIVADIILMNDNNEILLVKRSAAEDFPGYWSIPGGTANEDEDPIECVRREVKEELNINLAGEVRFFKKYFLQNTMGDLVEARYYVGKITNENIKTNKEIENWSWWKIGKELLELKYAFNQKEVIADFLDMEI